MLRQYFRIIKMNDSRLTKKIYSWDIAFSEQHNVQTWASEIRDILLSHNLANYFDPGMNFCQEILKLRAFITYKEFGLTPSFITMPFFKRKFLALSRLSNLAIRLETGRYERPRLEEHQRLCKACRDGISVENEIHIYFPCGLHDDLRRLWINTLNMPANFHELPANEKFKLIISQKMLKLQPNL